MKCSRIACPIQYNTLQECNLSKDECVYFTEEIDYEKIYEYTCNHIADLVVKKLKENKNIEA